MARTAATLINSLAVSNAAWMTTSMVAAVAFSAAALANFSSSDCALFKSSVRACSVTVVTSCSAAVLRAAGATFRTADDAALHPITSEEYSTTSFNFTSDESSLYCFKKVCCRHSFTGSVVRAAARAAATAGGREKRGPLDVDASVVINKEEEVDDEKPVAAVVEGGGAAAAAFARGAVGRIRLADARERPDDDDVDERSAENSLRACASTGQHCSV